MNLNIYFQEDEDETDFDCRRSKGQRELEDDFKKAKKRCPQSLSLIVIPHSHLRQAMLDNIGVLVATVIMVLMALTIVTLKVSQDINIFNQDSNFKVEK